MKAPLGLTEVDCGIKGVILVGANMDGAELMEPMLPPKALLLLLPPPPPMRRLSKPPEVEIMEGV